MEIGEIKQSDTIGKLKYNNVYILDSMCDNYQDKLQNNVLDNRKRMKNIMQMFCH